MSLKKNVLANYLGTAWSALMGIAFVPLYIKYLGIEAYGLIGIFAILQSWLTLLDLGMTPSLSREMARCSNDNPSEIQRLRNLLRSIEITALGVACLIALGVWVSAPWLAGGWLKAAKISTDTVAQAIAAIGFVIGLRFIENIYRSSLMGLQRQVLVNTIASLIATLRGLGAVVVLIYVKASVEYFFIWQAIVSLLGIAVFATAVYHTLPIIQKRASFSLQALSSIWLFALGSLAITLQSLLLMQIDKLMLSRLLSLENFGYYTFAVMVSQSPSMVVGPVTQAFYPRFTKAMSNNNQSDLIRSYHAAAQLISVMLASATVLLVFFGHDLLMLWTKNNALTDQTYKLVAILSCGSLLNGLMNAPYFLQLAAGWTGLIVRINTVIIIIIVPLLFWLVPLYGAKGAAWVWLSINSSYIIVSIQLMHRKLIPSEKWRWYLQDVILPILAAVVTAFGLKLLLPETHTMTLTIIKLATCALIVSLSTSLAASTVRKQIFNYLHFG